MKASLLHSEYSLKSAGKETLFFTANVLESENEKNLVPPQKIFVICPPPLGFPTDFLKISPPYPFFFRNFIPLVEKGDKKKQCHVTEILEIFQINNVVELAF